MENFNDFEKPINKPADIGDIIDEGFAIYKKIAVPAGLAFLLLFSVIGFVVSTIISKYIDIEKLKDMKNFNPETLTWEQNMILVGGIALFSALTAPFIAGILKMSDEAANGQEPKFSSFWYYINTSRFIHIVLITLLIAVINFGLDSAIKAILPETVAGILGILISIVLSTFCYLAIPFILFKEMNFIDALKSSFQVTSKNFMVVFLAMIVSQIFALLGLLAFCVGIIFTLPIVEAFQYVTFKKVVN